MKSRIHKWLRLNKRQHLSAKEKRWLKPMGQTTYKLKGKMFLIVTKPWRNHHYFDGVMENIKRRDNKNRLERLDKKLGLRSIPIATLDEITSISRTWQGWTNYFANSLSQYKYEN